MNWTAIITSNALKGLCHEIYQNSLKGNYSGNCHQIEWYIKVTIQNVKRRYTLHSKYKYRHGWTNFKKIETDCDWGFWKRVSLTSFQSFFVACNVCYNAWESYLLDVKLWSCYWQVISQVPQRIMKCEWRYQHMN